MKSITILAPVYNEESVLPQLFDRLDDVAKNTPNYKFKFLFINDGSVDESLSIIADQAQKDTRISYINLSRNFGKEIAMLAGIDHTESDAAVIIDADLQDPPELIKEMIAYWEDGYDDVYARRSSRQGETWLKKKPASGIIESSKNRLVFLFKLIPAIFACWISVALKPCGNFVNLSAIPKQFSAGSAIGKKRFFTIATLDWLARLNGIIVN